MDNGNFYSNYGAYALITGASSGIGLAFCELLAEQGLNLIIVARRSERLQALRQSLESSYGVEVVCLQADIGSEQGVRQVLEASERLDVGLVISNAGFGARGEFSTIDSALLLEILRVNCQAPLLLSHGMIPRLKSRGRGGIIFTSSVEAIIGCPYSAAYSACKALVKNLGEALWGELNPEGIDVLVLCPGATDTEALDRSGVDKSRLPHVMAATEVAKMALDNIKQGPVLISSDHYRNLFEQLSAMPRDKALAIMAERFEG